MTIGDPRHPSGLRRLLLLSALALAATTPPRLAEAEPTGSRRQGLSASPDLYLPERFEPRPGGGSFLSIAVPDLDKSAIPGGELGPVMGFRLLGNISRNAYTPVVAAGDSVDTVAWRYVTEPVVDLRLPVGTVIGAGLPIVVQRGRVESTAPPYDGDALGDGWLEATHAWQVRSGYLGGTLRLSVPTGNEDLMVGNGALRLLSELIGGHPIGQRFLIAGSLGYRKALRAKSDRSAGDEFVYRLGARMHAWQRRLHVETALVGAVGVEGPVDDRVPTSNLPLEWLLGVRWPVFSPAAMLRVGMGFGLDRGEGMPLARFLVGLDVACALGECLRPSGPLSDKDGDGVPDYDDRCPGRAEDRDDFADDDGCPDIDNDEDGVPDTSDRCPLHPEDMDGFDDSDGCPDPDNDGDGLRDESDKCPNEAEDIDGYHDSDGCPDDDDDNDGIPDTFDMCPRNQSPQMERMRAQFSESAHNQPSHPKRVDITNRLNSSMEDLDGFEDQDGCPDFDHDRDGVPDWDDHCPDRRGTREGHGCPQPTDDDLDADGLGNLIDRCPEAAETVNRFVDSDGCPDDIFRDDFQRYFGVYDDGRIRLEQDLQPLASSSSDPRQIREAANPANIDGEADHRARVVPLLASMLDQLADPDIRLQIQAPAGPVDDVRAFAAALTAALQSKRVPDSRVFMMCGVALPDERRVALQLCLPPRAARLRRRGLPQNLPHCPDEAEQEEHACPP